MQIVYLDGSPLKGPESKKNQTTHDPSKMKRTAELEDVKGASPLINK